MRFVTDVMVGRLSRWLRLLGYDTRSDVLEDEELLRTAEEEERILLTRDKDLINRAQRKKINSVYIGAPDLEGQILQLFRALGRNSIELDPDKSRCPLCNGRLEKVGVDDLEGNVPPKVLEYHSEFWRCLSCKKVYWMGRHWENIRKKINDANSLLERDSDQDGDRRRRRELLGEDGQGGC